MLSLCLFSPSSPKLFPGRKPRVREKKDIASQVDPAGAQELIKIDRMSDTEIDEKLAQMLVS